MDTRPSTVSPSASSPQTSGENRSPKPRMNAVACEVQVTATGARPSEKGSQRELFTEETTTALVFENGGVLRLAAAVVPGQLLFLTHKESKREVVAQVTRKRDFRPMICYVEVEFSEPARILGDRVFGSPCARRGDTPAKRIGWISTRRRSHLLQRANRTCTRSQRAGNCHAERGSRGAP